MSYSKFVRRNVLQFATRQNADLKVNEAHRVLIDTKYVTLAQFTLAQEMMKAANTNLFTRKMLRAYHFLLRKKIASPYFISKNVQCKAENHMYNLAVLRCFAHEAKACETFDAIATIAKDVAVIKAKSVLAEVTKTKATSKRKRSAEKIAACDAAHVEDTNETLQLNAASNDSQDASELIAQFERECNAIEEDENESE